MSTIKINPLTTKDTNDIIQIFSEAFESYPLMEYFFGDRYKQSIKHLIQFICDTAFVDNGLLIGGFLEDKLRGVAYISLPQNEENNHDVETTPTPLEIKFAEAVGEQALMRIEAYSDLKKANKFSSPHFYINALAINPQNQGKGIGGAILSHIHQMSEQHPDSQGVALDTQTERNVGYYQRFAYTISNTVELEDVNNWFMFRPNSV